MPPSRALQKPAAGHLAHALFATDSLCIKCGFCLPTCPTYRETGREAASPRGRLELMYSVARGELPLAEASPQLWLCLGCLACETACPSGIRFGEMMEAARCDDAARADSGRARSSQARSVPGGSVQGRGSSGAVRPQAGQRLLYAVLERPRLLRLMGWLVVLFQRSGLRLVLGGQGLLRLVPPLARLERSAPFLPAPFPWRAGARRRGHLAPAAGGAAGGTAEAAAAGPSLFTGCVMDAHFGRVHAATVKMLALCASQPTGGGALSGAARCSGVTLAPGQTCCGALHLHAGHKSRAQALARRNIVAFEAGGEQPIIVNSAGCGAVLKGYGALLGDDAEFRERARGFAARVRDVSEHLAAERDAGRLAPPSRHMARQVAYDDACHLSHGQGVREQPRRLLSEVPGLTLVPLAESDWCCGSAGTYSLDQPEMSALLLARKIAHLRASGAEIVASGNPGCLLQLRLGARRAGLRLRVLHPVELLADGYE